MTITSRSCRGTTERTPGATVKGSQSPLACHVLIAQAAASQKCRAYHRATSQAPRLAAGFCKGPQRRRNEGTDPHGHRTPPGQTRGVDRHRRYRSYPGPRRQRESGLLSTVSRGSSLYVTIFPDPFNQGSAGDIPARYTLPGKDLFLHTARPIRKDRASPGSVPGPIDDWRVVASSTRYIRTREPQELR
jgi:hypothetical protein